MTSPFYIVGATAVGKTDLAIAVAERCGAEIVNADAFQVYAGLDLLTAKPSAAALRRVPHHLVGTVPLNEPYNVARYREQAQDCLAEVKARQRPVLVVGGSGMYVKALTHGLSPLPPAQPVLRGELESLELSTLQRRLELLDPQAARTIDGANKRRLVRAIEICEATGQRFSDFCDRWYAPGAEPAVRGVFLTRNRDEMKTRIKHRTQTMFSRGVVEEVASYQSVAISDTGVKMIGLSDIQNFLAGRLALVDCVERVEIATRQYAKRQSTWFKRENVFETIQLVADQDNEHIVESICERVAQQARSV